MKRERKEEREESRERRKASLSSSEKKGFSLIFREE